MGPSEKVPRVLREFTLVYTQICVKPGTKPLTSSPISFNYRDRTAPHLHRQWRVLCAAAAVRIQEEIPHDPTCFPPSLLFVCLLRRHVIPIDWFTLIDIVKRYVINTIIATLIQIQIRAQLPTQSYGTIIIIIRWRDGGADCILTRTQFQSIGLLWLIL